MKITLTPVRMDTPLTLRRNGDVLTFNGAEVDLAAHDPETAPCDWIVGAPVPGPEGWEVTVILPHGPEAPPETLFPAPVLMTGDGEVPLPPWGPAAEGIDLPAADVTGPEGWTTHD